MASWISGRKVVGVGRVVPKALIFDELPESIYSETIHSPLQPEAKHAEHSLPDLRIAPVEVGLLPEVSVIVVLPRGFVERPGRAPEDGEPVVRRPTVGGGISPDVPVTLRILARGARLYEPGVLLRGVVGHVVDYHFGVPMVRLADEGVEVRKRAEHWVYVGVVGDVVPEVLHWRGVERRYPERVHPQPLQVVEPRGYAGQVSDAVAVGVLE
jgi:hypothetical protein